MDQLPVGGRYRLGSETPQSSCELSVVVPLLFTHADDEGRGETFRQLLARIKDLLVREGLEIRPSDLEAYTRFVSPHGDLYLLDTSVCDCLLPDEPELCMVKDQHLKRKREDDGGAAGGEAAPYVQEPPKRLQEAQPAANLKAYREVEEEVPWPEPPLEVRPSQLPLRVHPAAAPPAATESGYHSSSSSSSFPTPSYLSSSAAPPPSPQPTGGPQTPTNINALVTPSSHGLILDQKKYATTDRFLSDLMNVLNKPDSSKPTPEPAPASPSYSSPSSSPPPSSSPTPSSTSMSAPPPQSFTSSNPLSEPFRFPHPSRTQPLPQQQQVAATSTPSFPSALPSTSVRSTARNAPFSFSSSSSRSSYTYMDYSEALRIQAQQSGLSQKLPDLDDVKNEVQSYYQVRHGPRVVPEYVTDRNDAATGFYVSLDISKIDDGRGIVGRGVAPKKKDAEKLAALDALAKLQRQGAFPLITVDESPNPGGNPKTRLNEVFQSLWRTNPVFTFHTDPATGHFTAEVHVGEKVLRATGLSKAKASADVAEKALKYLSDMRLMPRF